MSCQRCNPHKAQHYCKSCKDHDRGVANFFAGNEFSMQQLLVTCTDTTEAYCLAVKAVHADCIPRLPMSMLRMAHSFSTSSIFTDQPKTCGVPGMLRCKSSCQWPFGQWGSIKTPIMVARVPGCDRWGAYKRQVAEL